MAHPPRSKPPLRSSSGPPNPCITPSTETLVVVVNLMTWSPHRPNARNPSGSTLLRSDKHTCFHHARLALVERIDGLLMFGNGLLMMTIVALSYLTALVGQYLNTPAGKTAVVTYGLFVLGTSAAWNVFMLALRPERGLLKPGVPPE